MSAIIRSDGRSEEHSIERPLRGQPLNNQPMRTAGKITITCLSLWIVINLCGTLPDLVLLLFGTTLDEAVDQMTSFGKILTAVYFMGIGSGLFLTFCGAGLFFLIWLFRASKSLESFGVQALKFSPGWVVGWYFIPVFYLFKPFQAFAEIWQSSSPDHDTTLPAERAKVLLPPLIMLWWFFWIFSNIVDNVAMYFSTANPEDILLGRVLPMMAHLIDTAAAVLTIALICKTNQRYQEKWMQLQPIESPPEIREGHIV